MTDINFIFKVIFQNDDFLIINKENKISTQKNKDYVDSIEQKLEDLGEPFISLPRCGIVHRLDKDTTGLLIIAKNLNYYNFLINLFKERKIEKEYISLHNGFPESDKGEITFYLKKKFSKNKRVKMQVDPLDGKLVKLYFELISKGDNFSLLKINPITGRTHQIRLAFHAIDFHIYNDPIYNSGVLPEDSNGQYLHAYSLRFFDKNKKFEFIAELPDFFSKKIKNLNLSF